MTEKNWVEERLNELKPFNDKYIFERITVEEFDKKIEGEYSARRAIFLSLCSCFVRNLENPINTCVCSGPSSGKSFICKAITKILPKQLLEYRCRISPTAFTYWHSWINDKPVNPKDIDFTWNGKVCYLEDASNSVLNSEVLKVMATEGMEKSTITQNGRAIDIEVKGNPSLLVTTATANPNNEMMDRFNFISLDENSEQTEAILKRKSIEAMTGVKQSYSEEVVDGFLKLKRIKGIIPFADKLYKHFDTNLEMRRFYPRFLDLIKSSTALHQFNREQNQDGFYLATKQDYEIARDCVHTIRIRNYNLPNNLSKTLDACKKMECSFTIAEMYSRYPVGSERQLQRCVNKLYELKFLSSKIREDSEARKKPREFKVMEVLFKELPEFEKL